MLFETVFQKVGKKEGENGGEKEEVENGGEKEEVENGGEKEEVENGGEKEEVENDGEKEEVENDGEKEEVENDGENFENYVNCIVNKEENNKTILTSSNLDELKNIVHNIFIELNCVLNQNNPYLFNKKRNLTLILLLKNICQIIFINDPNILLFKNQFINNYMNEIITFKNKLDEKINTQQISININNFYKKIEKLIKFVHINDDINNSKNINTPHNFAKNKRPINDDMRNVKKVKV
ncbi:hypothetical protein [Plasmodium yoelii yoelii]|nr:hypothetical protein [Plasmodium yoelii yoelii]